MSDKFLNEQYKAEIKSIQEFYHPVDERALDSYKHWRQDWLGYIECTYPWSGGSVLETIVYRLEVLRADLRYFCHHVDGAKMIKELDEAIELGRKLVKFDYDADAYKYLRHHSTNYARIQTRDNPPAVLTVIQLPAEDPFDFMKIIDDTVVSPIDTYLAEHNLKNNVDVEVCYYSVKDAEDVRDTFKQMMADAKKARDADKNKFFKILANKLESWGD